MHKGLEIPVYCSTVLQPPLGWYNVEKVLLGSKDYPSDPSHRDSKHQERLIQNPTLIEPKALRLFWINAAIIDAQYSSKEGSLCRANNMLHHLAAFS